MIKSSAVHPRPPTLIQQDPVAHAVHIIGIYFLVEKGMDTGTFNNNLLRAPPTHWSVYALRRDDLSTLDTFIVSPRCSESVPVILVGP